MAEQVRRAWRRVVAKLPIALYARLYTCKLRTRRSLEALLKEGAELVIEKYASSARAAEPGHE